MNENFKKDYPNIEKVEKIEGNKYKVLYKNPICVTIKPVLYSKKSIKYFSIVEQGFYGI